MILLLAGTTLPGVATAHDSEEGVDTSVVLDQVWGVMGPGCVSSLAPGPVCQADATFEEQFDETAGLSAEEIGGQLTESTTHDEQATHTISGYVCEGLDSAEPLSGVDLAAKTNYPFYHSDLENGIFEATGSFFVNFDFYDPTPADGESDVDKVDQVWFGYAHTFPWPASSSLCETPDQSPVGHPFPTSGAYYEFYRGDTDGSDGWEIPVNTLLVPDMAYGAIIRALDETGSSLLTAFVYANVNNYPNEVEWVPGGTPQGCEDHPVLGSNACDYHDVTPPYPTVKGALDNGRTDHVEDACDPTDIAIAYGEPLAAKPTAKLLDGDDNVVKTVSLTAYTPERRDVDALARETTEDEVWGDAYCIDDTEAVPATIDGHALKITADDLAGNTGVIDIPLDTYVE